MFGCEGKAAGHTSRIRLPCCGFFAITRAGGLEIPPAGEEVDVTESEVPGLTGTWCKREMLRIEAE
ncbi:hypothetical protein GCM10010398_72220 [Streptomyces fimbriatus]